MWTREDEDQMEEKFSEFRRKKADKSLRWDFGHRTIKFDDNLKERNYWELRFEDEYLKVIKEEPGSDLYLVADIHAYVYYVTDFILLGSHDYPDEKNCLTLLKEDIIYYNRNWNCDKKADEKNNDVHLYGLAKIIKDKIEGKFKEFQRKKADRSLSWDFGHRTIKFDDNLDERDYWVTYFEEEYTKVIEGKPDSNSYLLADIHAYIYYVMGNLMLGSRYPDKKNCLKLLEQKIIYHNR